MALIHEPVVAGVVVFFGGAGYSVICLMFTSPPLYPV